MQKASELVPSGMLSVLGRRQAQYKHACMQAKEYCKSVGIKEPVCSVANYLFPDGRVIAGHQKVRSISSLEWSVQKNPLRCLFLFVVFVSSGSGFPPAKLQASPVHKDQTGACEWGFSHWADGVSYWTSPRGAQAGGGQSDSHMVYTMHCNIRQKTIKNGKDLLVRVAWIWSIHLLLLIRWVMWAAAYAQKHRLPSPAQPSRVARFGGFGLDFAR